MLLYSLCFSSIRSKGIDLLLQISDRLMQETNIQIALVGTGDESLENAFVHLSKVYPKRFSALLKFDNTLAHKTIAGAIFFNAESI